MNRTRRWWLALAVIAALGLAWRIAYVLAFKRGAAIAGDSFYYHYGANLLATGHWFVEPFNYVLHHRSGPSAYHPPLYLVTLAGASLVGLKSYLAHQLEGALIGTASTVVMGLLGRRIASPRAGLVAAGIAAVYPNFWLNDGLVMSETLVILTTAVVVLAAYRFWQAPRRATAIALGATLGLAALTRAEDILLVPLVVIPLAFVVRRVRLAVLACAVAALVLAPWTIYNLTRFSRPVLLTNGLGPTLQVSYCNRTFYGSFTGYWSFPCISTVPLPRGDESVQSDFFRARAVKYARAHEARLPVVVLARVGRAWALYRPGQQITLDRIETRELWASRVGLGMYYVLALASVGGVVALRRRRVPVFPLLALVATVTVTVAVTFGQTRYRAAAEVAVVALAAVAIDAVLSRRVARPPELASVAFEPDEQPAGTAPLPVL